MDGLTAVLLALVNLFILYWVIRNSVAHGMEDFHRRRNEAAQGAINIVQDATERDSTA